ncbi:glycosyltransferase family 87 protein [Pedobacter duraquae]|uniref:Uncharacterized protein DUF2029 n=1 Tax=Pedobacter duraquae TaxID=425511 RepID=A0A4R6IHV9_9SPHI|nr:glycosyltransferase family 87 protein [Pedobacter duraquae]TDO21425.1 uncharacterized protein DUF2029 [Pedobacter duraquae]
MGKLESSKLQGIKNFFSKGKVVIGVYIVLALVAALKQYLHHSYNNYLIFKYVYVHVVNLQPLFVNSPMNPYFDCNHYGPTFSILIAPFAMMPDAIGVCIWNIANVLVLLWGVFSLPISYNKRVVIAWICAHEALTSLFSYQFNVALAGMLLLIFSYTLRNEHVKSAFFIALGTLVKLYGIVGLAFFFFTEKKGRFILVGLAAFAVLFALPMLFSSPSYIVQCYADWYESLVSKNASNTTLDSFQDISLMGIIRRVSGDAGISNGPMLLAGLTLFALPYIRTNQYKAPGFRLLMLASTLIFTVIFSSGSESPTYIIAFAGVAIWFVSQPTPKRGWVITLLVFAFLVTSLSPTDIIPRDVRYFIRIYSLKALPCAIVWFVIIYQLMLTEFRESGLKAA